MQQWVNLVINLFLAGYSAKSAEVVASENLRKPEVLKKVEAILNSAGLSDEAMAKRL